MNLRKNIVITAFLVLGLPTLGSSQAKQTGGKTYAQQLIEIMTTGQIIELPDFPETEIFKQFLEEEAAHKGESPDIVKEEMKKTGVTSYLLDLLGQGQISSVEFANLMNVHWVQALRMAYASGTLKMSDEFAPMLSGEVTPSIQKMRRDRDIIVKEISYRSSLDDLFPLYAEIAYDPKVKGQPVMVIQHGDYPGTRMPMIPVIHHLAKKGIFGLAVSKRGRDGSAGHGDAFGKEIFDIYDAVEFVKRDYAPFIDPTNINIRGGSGGGMDTLATVVHFPDYFRIAAPYVGPPDLDHWIRQIEPKLDIMKQFAEGSWSLFSNIFRDIGGKPADVPDRYLVRNWVLGAINNPYTQIHIFWDEEDGAAPSITERSQAFQEEAQKYGLTNVYLHFSRRGDKVRYLHWGVPDHNFASHYFLPQILSKSHPAPLLADSGRLVILGFLKTNRFFIQLGEGNDAVAQVDYSLSSDLSTFNFRRRSSDPTKKGQLVFDNTERQPFAVLVNNETVTAKTSASPIRITFGLDDRISLKKIEP